MGQGEDEPGVFGDNVGGDEIDFGEFVGDGASVDAAVGVEVVEAVLGAGSPSHDYGQGCPTLRDFRRVGTSDDGVKGF